MISDFVFSIIYKSSIHSNKSGNLLLYSVRPLLCGLRVCMEAWSHVLVCGTLHKANCHTTNLALWILVQAMTSDRKII